MGLVLRWGFHRLEVQERGQVISVQSRLGLEERETRSGPDLFYLNLPFLLAEVLTNRNLDDKNKQVNKALGEARGPDRRFTTSIANC